MLNKTKIEALKKENRNYGVLERALHVTYHTVAGDLLASLREMSSKKTGLKQIEVIEAALDYVDTYGHMAGGVSRDEVAAALKWYDSYGLADQQRIAKAIFPYKKYE